MLILNMESSMNLLQTPWIMEIMIFTLKWTMLEGHVYSVKGKLSTQWDALDSNFFMYWEDVNWCLTGLKHGYKSVYSFKSKIWHKYGASSASDFKIYYLNRNRIYVIKEHAKRNEYYYFLIYFFGYRLWYESLDYLDKSTGF